MTPFSVSRMSMREHPDEAITRANVELYKASLCIQNCRTSILQLHTIRKEEKRCRMQVTTSIEGSQYHQ
ncbi:hypothetical protein EJ05DRAFT_481284 [Pseudovirgaria hyperparasitica]|uniref:Uncharacterized protein n=1 Tax=Pseudovirgaria hyperparasitica TaxID=470096 RepID=A0A6A6VP97_9PEZI|nr:uncharacterized protein EJ05DRAFT_481284 [Pseudovirgaria hyperparasitica]KAF2752448.1 hypothetical protein EJ05DRAFT_481284 [Pseudovirgaria hyperparasitica]